MPRTSLTDRFIQSQKAVPAAGQVDWFDLSLPSFGCRVSQNGVRSFFVLTRIQGRRVRLTLRPSYPSLGLGDARTKAKEMLRQIAAGIDPREEKKRLRTPVVVETYETTVESYIELFQKGRRGNSTWKETRRLLLKEGATWLSDPLAKISRRDIIEVLDGIMARGHTYLANRTFAALRTFFGWCASREKVSTNPMLGMERPWDGEATRDRVFSDDEIQALWQAAAALPAHPGAFLKLLILTGKRKNALATMRWDEVSPSGVWTPPPDGRRRTTNKRTHPVPLPPLARRVLAAVPRVDKNPFVFVGRRNGGHLDPGSSLQRKVQTASGVADFYWHACRHTLETRLAELGIQPHLRDLVLDHAPLRGAGKGYDHHTYEAEIRRAIQKWATRVERIVAGDGVAVLR